MAQAAKDSVIVSVGDVSVTIPIGTDNTVREMEDALFDVLRGADIPGVKVSRTSRVRVRVTIERRR